MKILSCHIDAFGAMRDRSFPDLDAPVVVVEGSNEAGKSTFFHFLQTMLYGVYPVREENHPYAPRDGARLGGRLSLEAGDGGPYTVSRLLRSTVTGDFAGPDGRSERLGNRDVRFMHISRDVYQAIYALSLYDLVALQGKEKAWQAVQDRLVGGLGVDFIRPIREVVRQIDAEASALWRRDLRGNSESKRIAARQKILKQEMSEAEARDQELRDLTGEAEQCKQEDRKLRDERTQLLAEKHRIERLRPIRNHLQGIADAWREAGDQEELVGLQDDPGATLEEIARKIGELDNERQQLESEREVAGRVLAAVEAGAGFDLNIPSENPYEGLLRDRKRAEDELQGAERALVEQARDMLTAAWDDGFADALERIAPAALRERINRFEDVQREADTRRQAEETQKQAVAMQQASEPDAGALRKTFRNQAMLAGLLLAGACVAGVLGRMELAIGLGVAGAGFGYMAWQARTQARRTPASPTAPFAAGRPLEEIEADVAARRADVRELMAGLPVPDSRFDRLDMTLVSEVRSLQDAVGARRTAQERLAQRMDELQTRARREQDRIADASRGLAQERASLETEQDALKGRLRELGRGDLKEGIRLVSARKRARQLAETLEEKLATDYAGEDMAKARREIETLDRQGVAWDAADEEAIAVNERLAALDEEINALTERRTAAEKDIENLLKQPTRAALESEQEQLKSELESVEARHDRLRLLQHLVREADRRFREEHQPDVLQRASGYVQIVTGGRYERFDYDEDERLRVYPARDSQQSSLARPWSVEAPLSQGTLDQMYLAIRFALIDHLDEGQESLPVFLDEVFVNWDRERRAQCYDIFSEAAVRRQVFVFTCHPWLAEEMEQALSAKRILL